MSDNENKPKTKPTPETQTVTPPSFDTALSKAVVETLKPLLEDVSVENLMRIIPELIRHVEMYKQFTGEQKRTMVINMLNFIFLVPFLFKI